MKNNKEKIDKLINDSANILIVTDNGVMIEGNELLIANLFLNLVEGMIEVDFNQELLKLTFNLGLKSINEKHTSTRKKDTLEKMTEDIIKDIKKDLDNLFGDVKND